MRSRQRSVNRSAIWAYLVCFLAGSATIGLAVFAFRFGAPLKPMGAHAEGMLVPGRSPHVAAADARQAVKRTVATVVASEAPADNGPAKNNTAAVAREVLLARVIPGDSSAAASAMDTSQYQADPDADEGAKSEPWAPARSDTYRTVCVRLCDGSATPVSFATTRDKFKADAAKCQASCSSPTRLFYAKAGVAELDDMIDVHGASYADLANAFKFRARYDSACTCRAQPWEEASLLRHRQFAAAAEREAKLQSHAPQIMNQTIAATGERPRSGLKEGAGAPEMKAADSIASALSVTGAITRNRAFAVLATGAAAPGEPESPDGGRAQDQSAGVAHARQADAPSAGVSAPKARGAAKPPETTAIKGPKAQLAVWPAAKPRAVGAIAAAPKRHPAQRSIRAMASVPVAPAVRSQTRDIVMNVRGNARAQREFNPRDYWRLSFWEPR